ncbi:hypothetical protein F5I97DRAFT_1831196 [Phlebopus sp. FC_14]|nr:hypothetical protein F5I97DRAFT_1831196 [Phlebopus sp. FC_14]
MCAYKWKRCNLQECVHTLYMTGAIVPNLIIAADLHMCMLEEAEANHQWSSFKLICTPMAATHNYWWYQPINDGLPHTLMSPTSPVPMPTIPTMSFKENKEKEKAAPEDID